MISKRIEEQVENLLDEMRIKKSPVPVDEIARYHDIRIGRAATNDFSGFLLRKDGNSFIGVNDNDSYQRQRFTIAHELGHFFLHKGAAFADYPAIHAQIAFRDNKSNTVRTPEEVEANKFAAALLMPFKQLKRDSENLKKKEMQLEERISFLAEKYQVSNEAMTYRLLDL